jgi:hypothetical protein
MKKTATKKTSRKTPVGYEPDKVIVMVAVIAALSLVLLAAFGA